MNCSVYYTIIWCTFILCHSASFHFFIFNILKFWPLLDILDMYLSRLPLRTTVVNSFMLVTKELLTKKCFILWMHFIQWQFQPAACQQNRVVVKKTSSDYNPLFPPISMTISNSGHKKTHHALFLRFGQWYASAEI